MTRTSTGKRGAALIAVICGGLGFLFAGGCGEGNPQSGEAAAFVDRLTSVNFAANQTAFDFGDAVKQHLEGRLGLDEVKRSLVACRGAYLHAAAALDAVHPPDCPQASPLLDAQRSFFAHQRRDLESAFAAIVAILEDPGGDKHMRIEKVFEQGQNNDRDGLVQMSAALARYASANRLPIKERWRRWHANASPKRQ